MLSNQGSDTSRSKSIPRLSEFSQFKERFSGPKIQDTEVKSKKNTPNINIIKKDVNSVEYNYVNEDTENQDSNILNLNSSNFKDFFEQKRKSLRFTCFEKHKSVSSSLRKSMNSNNATLNTSNCFRYKQLS